jgi:hypothetical protein
LDNTNLYWLLVSAGGMMLVALAAVVYWRQFTRLQLRWFWVGVALWIIAVAVKMITAILGLVPFFEFLKERLPHAGYVAAGGIVGGLQSSLCEIGLTLIAAAIWPQLGRDAERAIGIGVGAGAFEAFLLGFTVLLSVLVALSGVKGTEALRTELEQGLGTPLVWLAPTAERVIAILCHASTRALVILGVVHRRPWMVLWGFVIFTYIDAVATSAHLSGKMGSMSVWWIELAILPAALVSIPILYWCYAKWRQPGAASLPASAAAS